MLTWQAHSGGVTSLAFVPDGGLLSTGTDGVLKHWDAAGGSLRYSWKLADKTATADTSDLRGVLADSTGRYAVIGLRTEGVRFFDLADTSVAGEFRLAHLNELHRIALKETVFCRGERDGSQLRVWQVAVPTGTVLAKSEQCPRRYGGRDSGCEIAVSPNGTQLLAAGRRFAWPSGEVTGPVTLARGSHFVVSADGDRLFGISGNRLVVWGFQVGVLRQKLKGHIAPITGLTTTPDGRKLWTCSADATVRQWDVESYRCEKCYGLKVGPLGCVAVSPDGLTAAAGSAHTGHIAVWDLD